MSTSRAKVASLGDCFDGTWLWNLNFHSDCLLELANAELSDISCILDETAPILEIHETFVWRDDLKVFLVKSACTRLHHHSFSELIISSHISLALKTIWKAKVPSNV
ncbi:unnamed protein product [Vicia faba]|uniref:Uncharacterized protein n=1 Tax=Vicia faba TaxID=3906 RepID=A0AAV0Z211_VICFA|nr:unnamed protein product [Vicia faba]